MMKKAKKDHTEKNFDTDFAPNYNNFDIDKLAIDDHDFLLIFVARFIKYSRPSLIRTPLLRNLANPKCRHKQKIKVTLCAFALYIPAANY